MTKATMQMVQDYLRKIKELEKENAELKHNKKTVAHLAYCLKEKMKERIADLEKENAELKKRNSTLKGMYAHSEREAATYKQFLDSKNTVCKNLAHQANVLQDQLTKAKEIIKQFLNDYPIITKEVLNKLEQFLKEIEK